METLVDRRWVLSAVPLSLSAVAGCTLFSDENRQFHFYMVNHTDESLVVDFEAYNHDDDDERYLEQALELPAESEDGSNFSLRTIAHLEDIDEGTDVVGELTINETRTETVSFTADCDVDDEAVGDYYSIRIYDDYVHWDEGCLEEDD